MGTKSRALRSPTFKCFFPDKLTLAGFLTWSGCISKRMLDALSQQDAVMASDRRLEVVRNWGTVDSSVVGHLFREREGRGWESLTHATARRQSGQARAVQKPDCWESPTLDGCDWTLSPACPSLVGMPRGVWAQHRHSQLWRILKTQLLPWHQFQT